MTLRPRDRAAEEVQPRYRPYTAETAEPWDELAHDRAHCPAVRSAELNAVQITSHKGVREALADHRRLSSAYGNIWSLKDRPPPEQQILGWADPPRHTRQRKLLVKALSASRIQNMRGFSERFADGLIDALSDQGSFEMEADFAQRMAAGHIAELLGIPEGEREEYAYASQRMTELFAASIAGRAARGYGAELNEWVDHLSEMVRARRAAGPDSDDLITQLCFAEVDGDYFEPEEIARVIQLLNAAGIGTTAGLIGNAAYLLDQNPVEKARFLSDIEGLSHSVTEEALRFEPPISGLWRTCTEPTRVEDLNVQAGEKLFAVITAGNHDPLVYDDPDEFIVDRDWKNLPPHLSFGQGIHHCIGMNLARLETQVAVERLYRRLPNLRVQPGFQPEFHPGPVLRHFRRLEMIFDPPTRRGMT